MWVLRGYGESGDKNYKIIGSRCERKNDACKCTFIIHCTSVMSCVQKCALLCKPDFGYFCLGVTEQTSSVDLTNKKRKYYINSFDNSFENNVLI